MTTVVPLALMLCTFPQKTELPPTEVSWSTLWGARCPGRGPCADMARSHQGARPWAEGPAPVGGPGAGVGGGAGAGGQGRGFVSRHRETGVGVASTADEFWKFRVAPESPSQFVTPVPVPASRASRGGHHTCPRCPAALAAAVRTRTWKYTPGVCEGHRGPSGKRPAAGRTPPPAGWPGCSSGSAEWHPGPSPASPR